MLPCGGGTEHPPIFSLGEFFSFFHHGVLFFAPCFGTSLGYVSCLA